jgi:acetolactate decarboxylase
MINFSLSTKRLKSIFCLLLFVSLLEFASCQEQADNGVIFQNSTINALLEGLYDGELTVGQMRKYGNLGLGTFNTLDGEMVVLDNHVYKVKASGGNVYPVDDTEKTPFSVVTMFHPDKSVNTDKPMSLPELQEYLDSLRVSQNIFYAFRIEGHFSYIKTRSVPPQKKPYPRLLEVVKNQPEFEFQNINGYLVGFWMPSYMKDINVTGYHLHFLCKDKKKGGHLLACQTGKIKIDIDRIYGFKMILPASREFLEMNLSNKSSGLDAVEKEQE